MQTITNIATSISRVKNRQKQPKRHIRALRQRRRQWKLCRVQLQVRCRRIQWSSCWSGHSRNCSKTSALRCSHSRKTGHHCSPAVCQPVALFHWEVITPLCLNDSSYYYNYIICSSQLLSSDFWYIIKYLSTLQNLLKSFLSFIWRTAVSYTHLTLPTKRIV